MADDHDDEIPTGYTHQVIGAVHVVMLGRENPAALARAVEHELIACEAVRIVVDLTGLNQVTAAHLEALRPLTRDSDRTAVRIREETVEQLGAALVEVGVREVITEHGPGRVGRIGLSNRG